ncbi:MAG: DUF2892 domain-containing protein [Acidobacteria bacterium]|nr:MAG: DUF2892 domain-containing protein [Acidobacteriota bacterium]
MRRAALSRESSVPGERLLKPNVSYRARLLWLLLAIFMLTLGWHYDLGIWAMALRLFALYPLIVAVAGWSPLRALRERSDQADRAGS